mmetsp:Transcript_12058/g.16309  ORF Transcript_12058/g.16309 Transcript_12058/m.16309 type:complete len:423 (+) Transcript_12058:35-1303(+)
MLFQIILSGLTIKVVSQGPGHGISKSTYACSEEAAEKTYYWLTKYLPVVEAVDDCQDRTCTCGKQSRVSLTTAGSSQQPGSGFGIHCTYAAGENDSRAQTNGGVTAAQVATAYADAINDWTDYSTSKNAQGYAGFALGLWSSTSLDSYIQAFASGSVAYLASDWTYNGATYYSVKVLVPDTPIVLDILGNSCSSCSLSKPLNTTLNSSTDTNITGGEILNINNTAVSGTLTPWYLSRTVDDLDTVRTYYKNVFGISPTSYTNDQGNSVLDFTLSSTATVIIRYIQVQGQTGTKTTSWLNNLLLTTDKAYQTSPLACWPLWGDFHYAYDDTTFNVLSAVTAATDLGFPYRSFASTSPSAGPSNAYVVEPSGMWIQLDGNTMGLPNSNAFAPDYCYTFCESNIPSTFAKEQVLFLRGSSTSAVE